MTLNSSDGVTTATSVTTAMKQHTRACVAGWRLGCCWGCGAGAGCIYMRHDDDLGPASPNRRGKRKLARLGGGSVLPTLLWRSILMDEPPLTGSEGWRERAGIPSVWGGSAGAISSEVVVADLYATRIPSVYAYSYRNFSRLHALARRLRVPEPKITPQVRTPCQIFRMICAILLGENATRPRNRRTV